jgi:hypothetical protein
MDRQGSSSVDSYDIESTAVQANPFAARASKLTGAHFKSSRLRGFRDQSEGERQPRLDT